MKTTTKRLIAGIGMIAVMGGSVMGQTTNFTNADSADSLISNAGNWSNGLPGAGNAGTISINAEANSTVLNGYAITQTGGTLKNSGTNTLALGTGSYTLNGADAVISGFRNFTNTAGGLFQVDSGTVSAASGADTDFDGSFIANGGSITFSRRLTGSGTFTINGGTVTSSSTGTDNTIGGSNLGAGDFFLNGGDIDFRFMQVGSSGIDFSFGGTFSGNLTIENFGGFRHNPNNIDLDFATGSRMSLTLTNPVAYFVPAAPTEDRYGWANDNDGPAWAEALWADGRLTAASGTIDFNDVSWSDASNSSVGLGNGEYFSFDGNTLVLAAIPEPSTLVLMGLVGLASMGLLRRRK